VERSRGMKRQRNNNRSLVHDSVNHPRLRSSSSSLGLDIPVAINIPARYYRVRLVP
jgi:hypothetical protein